MSPCLGTGMSSAGCLGFQPELRALASNGSLTDPKELFDLLVSQLLDFVLVREDNEP